MYNNNKVKSPKSMVLCIDIYIYIIAHGTIQTHNPEIPEALKSELSTDANINQIQIIE